MVVMFAVRVVVVAGLPGQQDLVGKPRLLLGIKAFYRFQCTLKEWAKCTWLPSQLGFQIFLDHLKTLVELPPQLLRFCIQRSRLFHGGAVFMRVAARQAKQGNRHGHNGPMHLKKLHVHVGKLRRAVRV